MNIDHAEFEALIADATGDDRLVEMSPTWWEWRLAESCQHPRCDEFHAGYVEYGAPAFGAKVKWAVLVVETPCRRCSACLRRRDSESEERAARQLALSVDGSSV